MTEPGNPLHLGAVVLTGGGGTRMGGVDKASIEIAGVSLLERALSAAAAAAETVVVGNPVPVSRPVTWAREEPSGGGPAAGLLAGLDRFRTVPELVFVLAVDMPSVRATTLARLTWVLEADAALDAALLVDESGRRQPLAGVYRYAALLAARPQRRAEEHGLPMRVLTSTLSVAEIPAEFDEAKDVDTWDDLHAIWNQH